MRNKVKFISSREELLYITSYSKWKSFVSSKAFENKGKHGQTVQGFSTEAAGNGIMECMP